MSKSTVTKFNKKTGKTITNNDKQSKNLKIVQKEVLQRPVFGKQKEKTKQPSSNLSKLENKTVELREIVDADITQAKEINNDILQKNNTINKTDNAQELNVVHEKVSQTLSPEIVSNNMQLNNIQGSGKTPQDIIIVYEETFHQNNLENIDKVRPLYKVNSVSNNSKIPQDIVVVHQEVYPKSTYEMKKEKQKELLDKVNKKMADYQASKPSSGVFTEVVTHGAFTPKIGTKDSTKCENIISNNGASTNNSKALLGFPSSANDLALYAKSDLESDPNISNEVKEKVIEKLFALVSMVQHVYESKVRVMTEFEKYKDTHLKNELRREKEHSEQLYKLNMNFQNEVVQSIQRLKSELDISRNVSKNIEDDTSSVTMKTSSVDFNTSDDAQDLNSNGKINSTDDVIEQCKAEYLLDANEEYKVDHQD